MAKVKLSESSFKIIPEGTTIFKVVEVDDSKYEDFGKLSVKLQTAKGETHTENFTIIKANGELNEGALKAWSYFARTCLNNYQADEIDTQDIVGCYIKATVKHEEYTRTKREDAGEEGTAVRLNDYDTATVFGTQAKNDTEAPTDSEDADLDSFLDD
jgi:hypothetical protein